MSEKLAIFAEGLFAKHTGKTAHGVIRYGNRDVVAVIDSTCAGQTANEVEPFALHPAPIVATLEEAIEYGAESLLIGVAPPGGKLDPAWRPTLLAAIEAGLSLEAGLHTQLNDDPELREAAERKGVELRDLRAAPADLTVPKGPYSRPGSVRVVHSVGSDTVIGKKVVTLELDRAARERGLRSVYVPTGQTGVAIAGWGIAVDHVISDYVAGAGERLVHEGAERGDLLFVEGQGALFHPAYSGVTLGLLHGSAPDLLVLVDKPNATHNRNYPDLAIPSAARPDRCLRAGGGSGSPGHRGRDRTEYIGSRRGVGARRGRRGGATTLAWWPTTWCASGPRECWKRCSAPSTPRRKTRPDLSTQGGTRKRCMRRYLGAWSRAATRSFRMPTARSRARCAAATPWPEWHPPPAPPWASTAWSGWRR